METCCFCNKHINFSSNNQLPLKTKFGTLCQDCVSKGLYEKLQDLKTQTDFENFKRFRML